MPPRPRKPPTPSEWKAIIDTMSNKLSHEEKTIAGLLADGMTQKAIGERLGLTRSVVSHKAQAIAKNKG